METFVFVTLGLCATVVVFSCIAALIGAIERKRLKTVLAEQAEMDKNNFHILLYKECVKNNVTKINSKADKQRAVLIANKMKIIEVYESTVSDYFLRGEAAVRKEEAEKELAETNAKREKEQKEIEQINNRFQNLCGRDKRITIINDRLTELRKAEKAMDTVAGIMISSAYQEKETDWATLGGIASAIGGTGAGISVASQAQQENMQIRERNAANQAAVNKQAFSIYEKQLPIREKIRILEKNLTHAELALVDDNFSDNDLFDKLNIYHDYDVSKDGIVSIGLEVHLDENVFIFDNVPATIDGTLTIDVYVQNIKIGSTLAVLPMQGIYSPDTSAEFECKALIPLKYVSNQTLDFKISPNHLWIMEQ